VIPKKKNYIKYNMMNAEEMSALSVDGRTFISNISKIEANKSYNHNIPSVNLSPIFVPKFGPNIYKFV
jgi:hypothetical protein